MGVSSAQSAHEGHLKPPLHVGRPVHDMLLEEAVGSAASRMVIQRYLIAEGWCSDGRN